MDPGFAILTGVSVGAIAISIISSGLVKKYDPNQILYWHLNRNGDVEGFEDTNGKSRLLLSKNYGRYGIGIVKGILYSGTLSQAKNKLKNLLQSERLIARALGKYSAIDITILELNAKLIQINATEQKRFEQLYKEIVAENRDIFHMLQHDPEVGNVSMFETKIKNIILNGIKNGKTNEEMKIKAQKIGWAI
jgi:hypothetical protein